MGKITVPTIPAVQVRAASVARAIPQIPKAPVNPSSDQPGYRTMVKPDLTLEIELTEIDKAWRKYRSTNRRDAVYVYLSSVFAIVMRWRGLDCALKKSRAALRLQRNPPDMKPEAFGIVIFCTADPETVDAKTRSKWSRVLRYAARAKPPDQRLADFVKSKGGLNDCAPKFARLAH